MKLNKPLSAKKEFEPPKEFIKLLYQQACAGLMLFSYADGLAHIVDGIHRIHRAGWCITPAGACGAGCCGPHSTGYSYQILYYCHHHSGSSPVHVRMHSHTSMLMPAPTCIRTCVCAWQVFVWLMLPYYPFGVIVAIALWFVFFV